jgi:hypothetical protein
MALSGLVTLLNLVLCLIVGARLLRAGLHADRRPELALAIYFLASPFFSTICQGIVYGGMVDPRLALPEGPSQVVLGLGILGMAVGGAAICAFIAISFWSGSRWAWAIAIAGSALALFGFAFEALHEGFTIRLVPGPGHWTAWAGRTAPMIWLTVESLRYWRMLRRREALGLAEAVVVNRFLLWGIFSAATFVNLAADLIAHTLYTGLAGTSTEMVMEVMKPVLVGTMIVTMILSMISAAALFLTFFSPARYRTWLESRSLARRPS